MSKFSIDLTDDDILDALDDLITNFRSTFKSTLSASLEELSFFKNSERDKKKKLVDEFTNLFLESKEINYSQIMQIFSNVFSEGNLKSCETEITDLHRKLLDCLKNGRLCNEEKQKQLKRFKAFIKVNSVDADSSEDEKNATLDDFSISKIYKSFNNDSITIDKDYLIPLLHYAGYLIYHSQDIRYLELKKLYGLTQKRTRNYFTSCFRRKDVTLDAFDHGFIALRDFVGSSIKDMIANQRIIDKSLRFELKNLALAHIRDEISLVAGSSSKYYVFNTQHYLTGQSFSTIALKHEIFKSFWKLEFKRTDHITTLKSYFSDSNQSGSIRSSWSGLNFKFINTEIRNLFKTGKFQQSGKDDPKIREKISEIISLLFITESSRNIATYVTAPMFLEILEIEECDILSKESILSFPMSGIGAVDAFRALSDKIYKKEKRYDYSRGDVRKLIDFLKKESQLYCDWKSKYHKDNPNINDEDALTQLIYRWYGIDDIFNKDYILINEKKGTKNKKPLIEKKYKEDDNLDAEKGIKNKYSDVMNTKEVDADYFNMRKNIRNSEFGLQNAFAQKDTQEYWYQAEDIRRIASELIENSISYKWIDVLSPDEESLKKLSTLQINEQDNLVGIYNTTPVNEGGGSHWIAFCVRYYEDSKEYLLMCRDDYMDGACSDTSIEYLMSMIEAIYAIQNLKFNIIKIKTHEQQDGSSCGVFALHNAENFAKFLCSGSTEYKKEIKVKPEDLRRSKYAALYLKSVIKDTFVKDVILPNIKANLQDQMWKAILEPLIEKLSNPDICFADGNEDAAQLLRGGKFIAFEKVIVDSEYHPVSFESIDFSSENKYFSAIRVNIKDSILPDCVSQQVSNIDANLQSELQEKDGWETVNLGKEGNKIIYNRKFLKSQPYLSLDKSNILQCVEDKLNDNAKNELITNMQKQLTVALFGPEAEVNSKLFTDIIKFICIENCALICDITIDDDPSIRLKLSADNLARKLLSGNSKFSGADLDMPRSFERHKEKFLSIDNESSKMDIDQNSDQDLSKSFAMQLSIEDMKKQNPIQSNKNNNIISTDIVSKAKDNFKNKEEDSLQLEAWYSPTNIEDVMAFNTNKDSLLLYANLNSFTEKKDFYNDECKVAGWENFTTCLEQLKILVSYTKKKGAAFVGKKPSLKSKEGKGAVDIARKENHFVAYFIFDNNLLIIDPEGNPENWRTIVQKLQQDANNGFSKIIISKLKIQKDGSSCGPISAEIVNTLNSDTLSKIFNEQEDEIDIMTYLSTTLQDIAQSTEEQYQKLMQSLRENHFTMITEIKESHYQYFDDANSLLSTLTVERQTIAFLESNGDERLKRLLSCYVSNKQNDKNSNDYYEIKEALLQKHARSDLKGILEVIENDLEEGSNDHSKKLVSKAIPESQHHVDSIDNKNMVKLSLKKLKEGINKSTYNQKKHIIEKLENKQKRDFTEEEALEALGYKPLALGSQLIKKIFKDAKAENQSEKKGGTSDEFSFKKSHDLTYRSDELDWVLKERIEEEGIFKNAILLDTHKSYVFNNIVENIDNLLKKVKDEFAQNHSVSIIVPYAEEEHFIGLVFKLNKEGNLFIDYMDSENKEIPVSVKDALLNEVINIERISVKQQEYSDNCGVETIENFIAYLKGGDLVNREISQDKAIEMHKVIKLTSNFSELNLNGMGKRSKELDVIDTSNMVDLKEARRKRDEYVNDAQKKKSNEPSEMSICSNKQDQEGSFYIKRKRKFDDISVQEDEEDVLDEDNMNGINIVNRDAYKGLTTSSIKQNIISIINSSKNLDLYIELELIDVDKVPHMLANWAKNIIIDNYFTIAKIKNNFNQNHAILIHAKRTTAKVINIIIIDPLSEEDSEFKEALCALKDKIVSSLNHHSSVSAEIVYTGVQDAASATCGDMSLIILRELSDGESLDKIISYNKEIMKIASEPQEDMNKGSDQSKLESQGSENQVETDEVTTQNSSKRIGSEAFIVDIKQGSIDTSSLTSSLHNIEQKMCNIGYDPIKKSGLIKIGSKEDITLQELEHKHNIISELQTELKEKFIQTQILEEYAEAKSLKHASSLETTSYNKNIRVDSVLQAQRTSTFSYIFGSESSPDSNADLASDSNTLVLSQTKFDSTAQRSDSSLGWFRSVMLRYVFSDELKQVGEVIGRTKSRIDSTPNPKLKNTLLKDPTSWDKQDQKAIKLVLHPDKNGNSEQSKEDFQLVNGMIEDLKGSSTFSLMKAAYSKVSEKVEKSLGITESTKQTIAKVGDFASKATTVLKAGELVIDSVRMISTPTLENAEKVVLDSAHLYSSIKGMNYFSVGVTAYSATRAGIATASLYWESGEYASAALYGTIAAGDVVVKSAMYTAIPMVLAYANPVLGTGYIVCIAGYTGYHVYSSASLLYHELIHEGQNIKENIQYLSRWSNIDYALSWTPLQLFHDFADSSKFYENEMQKKIKVEKITETLNNLNNKSLAIKQNLY